MTIRIDNLSSVLTENELEILRKLGRFTISLQDGYAEIEVDNEDNAIQSLNSIEFFGKKLKFSKLGNSRDAGRRDSFDGIRGDDAGGDDAGGDDAGGDDPGGG
ncbi:hypothetical protein G7B40_004530 [Aetokthonos hydrillicola Thurmond2011]|jgi:hypothetical protein|uniref:Uncharacterized protein n=1 Tax=Aetokthonos hydrillicola Thurmond2011 TaxID=2712845 RepID=A0AAP5M3I9_9CYAN|nr:hypothetical protein [Aetokthonos hydrillicola]MBO3463777.1 hypothetical protein [Aetokthonos hydrillicola CCALA 1050]MBW4585932.1 hypothetical protein [Aetokthonos hydrillicola CCALA 1050]MDR9893841.1 hypothetical protein [Aetokthonos hydrillicola Thurmond2011]